MAIVYQHKTLDKGIIFYIGIGKTTKRAFSLKYRNPLHKNVCKKHGVSIEILYENLEWENACEIERKLIKLYGRRDKGEGNLVNMTDGGDGLNNPSSEVRARISKLNTGKKWSDESKKQHSLRLMYNNRALGHKHDELTKEKMRIANKKRLPEFWSNPERREKISDSLKGHIVSDITRNKISKTLTGISFVERYGEMKSNEIKDKMRAARLGKKMPNISASLKGRFVGEKNPMYGKTHTEEFKQKKREYFLTDKNPGKNKSDETKKRISESKKGIPSKLKGIKRKLIICPHCGKSGGEGLMQRWHFNNCKLRIPHDAAEISK